MTELHLSYGRAAGLLTGLLSGCFACVTEEPLPDQAIGFKEVSAHASENA